MEIKWVFVINIWVSLQLKGIFTQYANPDFQETLRLQYNTYKNPTNLFYQYAPQVWNPQDQLNYEDYEYNDYDEENICSCENCDDLKPFCRNLCPNCATTPSSLLNPSYFYLPFPYPYPMTSKSTSAPKNRNQTTVKTSVVTTTSTTTTDTITQKTTKKPVLEFDKRSDAAVDKLDESKVPDVITKSFQVKDKSPYMLTSLRRTKPNWMPKYGIVPISNKFVEKLMLQLRSMKVLHPRKDYLRDVDEIIPAN